MALSPKEKKELAKQRKSTAKQAQKFHKEQEKKKKSSAKQSKSTAQKKKKHKPGRLEQAVIDRTKENYEDISREEKFRRESDEKIRSLEPQDFEDGYYIDEYAEMQKREKRARVIRKQENEVIKRNKKPLTQKQIRRRRVLISVGMIALVLVIGIVLSLTVLFKTEKIDVEGDEFYYEDQITAFCGVNLQQNIFIASIQATPEKIVENLPYVEEAKVGFAIPDTVTIKITDAVPSYVIMDGNNYLLVSSKGRIIDSLTDNSNKYPELTCGELNDKTVGKYVDESIGAIVTGESWDCVTDYIPIDPSMTFTFISRAWYGIGFYNASKTPIMGYTSNEIPGATVSGDYTHGTLTPSVIPSNAAYVVLTGNSYQLSSTYLSLIRTA